MFSLQGNWVDLIIVGVMIYYATLAWKYGFISLLADFASFTLSLLISLRIYKFAAELLKDNFSLTTSLSNASGFILTAILAEMILGLIFRSLVSMLPAKIFKSKVNKIFGLLPALGEGLLLTAFILTAVIALPVRPSVKKAVSESKLGGIIIQKTSGVERTINQVFGGAINDALTYLTIEPKSDETIKLDVNVGVLTVDEKSETQMFTDLNNERVKRGLPPLVLDKRHTAVARDYARDMWNRKYFSHYNPEGETVADRFEKAKIDYGVIGENLAYAPTEETAHTGLMNSPGHRENILSTDYKKVGIGVIDNGIYGKIFVQQFSD